MRDQWRRPARLEAIQGRRLRRLVNHACRNVPLYRRLFDEAGVGPGSITCAADLRRLPVVTRAMLQQLPREDVTPWGVPAERLKPVMTSGSTGRPLTVFEGRRDRCVHDMVWTRASLASGRRLFDRTVYFKFYMPPHRWFERLGLWRKIIVPVTMPLDERVALMRRERPDGVRGNVWQLLDTAHFMRSNGIDDIRPRLICSIGAVLDAPSRTLIESVFRAPVFNVYGAVEVGCIAWECPQHRGLHVNTDTVVLEVLRDGRPAGPGETGRLVCTGLLSYDMPFIRYDLGDIGAVGTEPCPCGRGLPLLTSLEGRDDEFCVRRDGSLVSPSILLNHVNRVPGLLRFRVEQVDRATVQVQAVARPEAAATVCTGVENELKRILGPGLRIIVTPVDAIDPDPSGKLRSLISRVPAGW